MLKRSRGLAVLGALVLLLSLIASNAAQAKKKKKTPKEPTTTTLATPAAATVAAGALTPVSSCDDLRAYLSEAALESLVQQYASGYYYPYYYWGGWGMGIEATADAAAPSAEGSGASSGSSGGSAAPGSFTGTNVQEAGVDELDFVKTDGKYIYLLQGQELMVLKSWPLDKTSKVGSLTIAGYPSALFLHGDRALVVSNFYYYADPSIDLTGFSMASYLTRLVLVDLSDKAKPKAIRTIDLEGYLASGRLIGDDAYLVMNNYLPLPTELWTAWSTWYSKLSPLDYYAPPADKAAAIEKAKGILKPEVDAFFAKLDLNTWMPKVRDQFEGGATAKPKNLFACEDILRPSQASSYGTLNVLHLDMGEDKGLLEGTGLLASGWTVYASEDNLYTAMSNNWWWGWGWGFGSQTLDTEIHKFNLPKGGRPRYVASGKVEGWLVSQFAMSEHKGYLRVATNADSSWWGVGSQNSGSRLTVFDQKGAELVPVGAVTGIAPGEQIYAVRMLGDKGYLVTFRQVDPLFTIDLKDPKNPKLAGELKIPGYSAYLHPVDEDHILAVGMDGTSGGLNGAMQVTLFDVSDFKSPKEVQKLSIGDGGWAWSEALWDHHAFTYRDGVLAIPASYYTYDAATYAYGSYFSGLFLIDVDTKKGSLSEIGRVDHTDLGREACLAAYADYGATYCDQYGYGMWYSEMRRAIFIDKAVVSISTAGIKVNDISTPKEEIAKLSFFAK